MSVTRIIPEFLEKFVIVCIFFVCVQSFFSSTDAVQTAPRQLVAHQIVHDPQDWSQLGSSLVQASIKGPTSEGLSRNMQRQFFVCKNTVQPCWWFPHMCDRWSKLPWKFPLFRDGHQPNRRFVDKKVLRIPITGKMTIPNIRSWGGGTYVIWVISGNIFAICSKQKLRSGANSSTSSWAIGKSLSVNSSSLTFGKRTWAMTISICFLVFSPAGFISTWILGGMYPVRDIVETLNRYFEVEWKP